MPYAACSECKQIRTYDAFEHKAWERIRANLPAKATCCNEEDGKASRLRKRKTPAVKYAVCHCCKRKKIEDAFPRAQLAETEVRAMLPQCLI